jgi:hypothetical protein
VGTSVAQQAANPTSWGVVVKADDDNSGSIYVGFHSGITADSGNSTSGFRLKAGQALTLEISNTNLLYLIGSAASQKFSILGS